MESRLKAESLWLPAGYTKDQGSACLGRGPTVLSRAGHVRSIFSTIFLFIKLIHIAFLCKWDYIIHLGLPHSF